MNSFDANERAATFIVSPTPRCRKPLSRMNKDDPSLQTTRKRNSNSPRTNLDDSLNGERLDDSTITDDEEEQESIGDEVPGRTPRSRRDVSLPAYKPESSQPRNSPSLTRVFESEGRMPSSPDSPINLAYDLRNSPNYESAKNITHTSHSYEKTESRRRSSSEIGHEKTSRRGSVSKLKKTTNTSFSKICVYCVGFAILVGVCFVVRGITANSTVKTADESRRPYTLDDFRHTIRSIKDKFPGQGLDTWMDIEAGIAAVVDRSQPISMFVLFSNETRLLRCLADELGSASSRALLSKNSLSLEPEDMGDEYGDAIDRWRNEIDEKKAVVVHDLLKVDPRAIQALHTMCDRQNPLVKGAVYIMTIVTQDYDAEQSPDKFVENQLTNRFIGKVPDDKLQPLITRLMDGPIIPVTPEFVHDLLSVDLRAIQVFHAVCDRKNPLVDGAVLCITTIAAQVYTPGPKSTHDFVENQPTNRFVDKVPERKVWPLIARLAGRSITSATPEVGREMRARVK